MWSLSKIGQYGQFPNISRNWPFWVLFFSQYQNFKKCVILTTLRKSVFGIISEDINISSERAFLWDHIQISFLAHICENFNISGKGTFFIDHFEINLFVHFSVCLHFEEKESLWKGVFGPYLLGNFCWELFN